MKQKKVHRKPLLSHDNDVHDDESNWLIAYADLMTLLFGFFVIYASLSAPNKEMIEKLKQKTSTELGGTYTEPHAKVKESVKQMLKHIDGVTLSSTITEVTVVSPGSFFFETGSADLKKEAKKLIKGISKVLLDYKEYIVVIEGHSDDVPINTKKFPSNWELSSSRACSVARLLEEYKITAQRLRPVGFANTRPRGEEKLKKEDIEAYRSLNRRIEIKLLKERTI